MGMILALDPGTSESAWVCWDGSKIFDHGYDKNQTVLERLRSGFLSGPPVQLAVEMIASYGMPVGREVFETVLWIGRFLEAWDSRRPLLPWRLVYRRDVKLELCGQPRAKDANIRQALLDRVGPQGTKKAPGPTFGIHGDEWAALGVAVVASLPERPERPEAAA